MRIAAFGVVGVGFVPGQDLLHRFEQLLRDDCLMLTVVGYSLGEGVLKGQEPFW